MQPYAVKLVPAEDLLLLEQIQLVFGYLPEIDLGKGEDKKPILISCHTLARALSSFFPVKWVYGMYASLYQHSWLLTDHGSVIDAYPVACVGGPILIACEAYQLSRLYQPKVFPMDRRFSVDHRDFIRQVRLIKQAIKEVIETHSIQVSTAAASQ